MCCQALLGMHITCHEYTVVSICTYLAEVQALTLKSEFVTEGSFEDVDRSGA